MISQVLQNLKGVGKSRIYTKYWDVLNESEDFYDLASQVELKFNFDPEEIKNALNDAEKLYDYVVDSDIKVVTVFDEEYPKKLIDMKNKKPPILYVKGSIDALSKPNIAVIGRLGIFPLLISRYLFIRYSAFNCCLLYSCSLLICISKIEFLSICIPCFL